MAKTSACFFCNKLCEPKLREVVGFVEVTTMSGKFKLLVCDECMRKWVWPIDVLGDPPTVDERRVE